MDPDNRQVITPFSKTKELAVSRLPFSKYQPLLPANHSSLIIDNQVFLLLDLSPGYWDSPGFRNIFIAVK
jgi:hypothetical protein